MMAEKKIGEIGHYFTDISVAVLNLNEPLEVGERINILGSSTDFCQTVTSMEIDHEDVTRAEPGQEVAIKVEDSVRVGDEVYLIEE